jgi:hypothetical protein
MKLTMTLVQAVLLRWIQSRVTDEMVNLLTA